MRLISKLLIIASSLFLTINLAFANVTPTTTNPEVLIQSTVNALQAEIDKGGSKLANNPKALYAIIKKTVMPDVAINQMAGLALGPKWRSATPKQQQDFIDQFGQLLTKTYANALLTVSSYQITLNPLRSDSWKTAQYIAITGKVTSKTNGKSSNLTYYLERSDQSWKIYDLAIEGVSFLKNYQEQFQTFPDMDSLIAKIDKMND